MNLAIEYFLRRNMAKDNIEFPCSLFLEHQKDKIKLIITLYELLSKQIIATQWKVYEYSSDKILPPKEEKTLPKDSIFSDEFVVDPGYKLIEFQESPYQTGQKQHNDGYHAVHQEREYGNILDNFFFPDKHSDYRLCWLYSSFLNFYGIPFSLRSSGNDMEKHLHFLKQSAFSVFAKWCKWETNFIFRNSVAPELIFRQEYEKHKIKEERVAVVEDTKVRERRKRKKIYSEADYLNYNYKYYCIPYTYNSYQSYTIFSSGEADSFTTSSPTSAPICNSIICRSSDSSTTTTWESL